MAGRRFAGFYERRVFPWLCDRLTSAPAIERLRGDALMAARGRTLDIGFGAGANLPHYPDAVTDICAVDPNLGMHARARRRALSFRRPVRLLLAEGEHLPFADGVFDTAVSTLTLCTVRRPHLVLEELRRVLVPDGQLLVLEHGLAADASVARWQHRLNGVQNIVACGCHLNRPVRELVEQHGFSFETVRQGFALGVPRPLGWFTLGTATKTRAMNPSNRATSSASQRLSP
ncbi:MAG: class I SAM-dependent methyltransferase [Acidobacteriaceae bacterium]|jgi:ubiquinone/menaquinone biosynthesis C-methylase UbiE|nr:class I SAM-dependent methyltransferase [Acidobacteriaceae bacterium]